MARAGGVVPPNPPIARLHPPGRTGKLHTAHHRRHGPTNRDQILKVCAERDFVAQGVIAADQFAKPLSRNRVSDSLDTHRGKRFHAPPQRHARFARLRVRNRSDRPNRSRPLFRGQAEQSPRFQPPNSLMVLASSLRLRPPQVVTTSRINAISAAANTRPPLWKPLLSPGFATAGAPTPVLR